MLVAMDMVVGPMHMPHSMVAVMLLGQWVCIPAQTCANKCVSLSLCLRFCTNCLVICGNWLTLYLKLQVGLVAMGTCIAKAMGLTLQHSALPCSTMA